MPAAAARDAGGPVGGAIAGGGGTGLGLASSVDSGAAGGGASAGFRCWPRDCSRSLNCSGFVAIMGSSCATTASTVEWPIAASCLVSRGAVPAPVTGGKMAVEANAEGSEAAAPASFTDAFGRLATAA